MTSRRPIFDAVKAAGGRFPDQAAVEALDAVLDRLGVPRDSLTASPAALDLIKSFEGCRLTAYPDPGTGGDPWTIGWGSTGPDIGRGTVWTQEQADKRFAEHVAAFSRGVAGLVAGHPTTQAQFDALVSFAYNAGLGALRDSTLLKLHNAGRHADAAMQFGRWNKAGGRVLTGLTRRRKAEADLYLGGGS